MALIWMDGFDHYGDDETLMTSGAYASIQDVILDDTYPRTGSRSLRINSGIRAGFRRILGKQVTTIGLGMAVRFAGLPTNNFSVILASFRDGGNNIQSEINITSTGAIELTGKGVSAPCITPLTYHHVEIRLTVHDSAGSVEIRVDGVTVLDLTSIDTKATTAAFVEQIFIGYTSGLPAGPAYYHVDDIYTWDDTGEYNNDFIGDVRVYTLQPISDDSPVDWLPSEGEDLFEMINETKSDEDATYITATDPEQEAQFNLSDLPPEVVTIAGALTVFRGKKSSPGDNVVRAGLVVGDETLEGSEQSIGANYATYHNAFDGPFTKSGINGAKLNLKRTL